MKSYTDRPKCFEQLFAAAKLLLPAFLILHEKQLEGRKGVYLAIRHIDPAEVQGQLIGEMPAEKIEEKKAFAAEKINRMNENNEICSFMSEDVEKKQFGGGIRATDFFIAPSGFPPHLDQKFALMLSLMAEEITLASFVDISNISFDKVNEWRLKCGEQPLAKKRTGHDVFIQ